MHFKKKSQLHDKKGTLGVFFFLIEKDVGFRRKSINIKVEVRK